THAKLLNNDGKPNTIGCKVDGRVLCKPITALDLCHIEASKTSFTKTRFENDRLKLAIESKYALDNILLKPSMSTTDPALHQVPNIQLSGLHAIVHSLSLVDAGINIANLHRSYDLSLPCNIIQYAGTMVYWAKKLKNLKATCDRNATIHSTTASSAAITTSFPA
ncbi:hypothetical protein MBANPS3_011450, partial [Mucor bainieri]